MICTHQPGVAIAHKIKAPLHTNQCKEGDPCDWHMFEKHMFVDMTMGLMCSQEAYVCCYEYGIYVQPGNGCGCTGNGYGLGLWTCRQG